MEMTRRKLASTMWVLASWRAGQRAVQLGAGLEVVGMGHAHKPFEGAELVSFGLDDRLLGGGFALRFELRDGPQAGLDLVADVLGHQRHLLDDLLLVTEAREGGLELPVEPLELVEQARALAFSAVCCQALNLSSACSSRARTRLDQPAQELEMAGAAGDELVHHHAVKAFFGRHGQELLRQRQVLFGGKAKAVDDPPRLRFGRFDALANLHLLLARQQRHLAHLPQIHPHRVVQNIVAASLFLLVRLGPPVPLHLRGVKDFNLQARAAW